MHTSTAEQIPSSRARRSGVFNTTHWSMVLAAGSGPRNVSSARALERLCRDYWPPIFACIRRSGRGREEAEDLTQEFFASLLRYESFSSVDRRKGRFRSFLRAALNHFLSNRWHYERAQKRGGGKPVFSLDAVPGLEHDLLENAPDANPAQMFDRSWAHTVLARVLDRLRHEYEAAGQGERFTVLKVYLLAGEGPVPYAESAEALALSESAVKSAIYKLRQRYGEMLRAEVAQTLSDPSKVDAEIRALIRALSNG